MFLFWIQMTIENGFVEIDDFYLMKPLNLCLCFCFLANWENNFRLIGSIKLNSSECLRKQKKNSSIRKFLHRPFFCGAIWISHDKCLWECIHNGNLKKKRHNRLNYRNDHFRFNVRTALGMTTQDQRKIQFDLMCDCDLNGHSTFNITCNIGRAKQRQEKNRTQFQRTYIGTWCKKWFEIIRRIANKYDG